MPSHAHASRYVRPAAPASGIILQPRDQRLFELVCGYRYLTAEHVRELVFPECSRRVVELRLRKLWEHRYLDRWFLRRKLDGKPAAMELAGVPIYILGPRGRAELSAPGARRPGDGHLEHDLTAIDGLVALSTAARQCGAVAVRALESERVLWQKRQAAEVAMPVVPDAAFTLVYPPSNAPITFHLEIVRAQSKSGNQSLVKKLRDYARLNHDEAFARVFGHTRLRAVLFATTSARRAGELFKLLASVDRGERLFWFGAYEERERGGRPAKLFTAERILDLPWRAVDGIHTLRSPDTPTPIVLKS